MNIKNLLSKKKVNVKAAAEFFDKKGFYIVLILCVVVVGATAVFITTRNMGSLEEQYEAENIIPEELAEDISIGTEGKAVVQSSINQESALPIITKVEDGSVAAKAAAGITDKENINTASKSNTVNTKQQASPPASVKPEAENISFIAPVYGEITFDYSKDKLAYSKTLGDWRTHNGVDISSDRGTPVKAAADGFVSEIKKDPRFGITVIIDHQNGFRSVYANLAGDDMVTVNQKVKQGDVMGSVGNTALFESAEAPHLHFEVFINGVLKDPKAYLPKK